MTGRILRRRILLPAAGVLAAGGAAFGFIVWWSQAGPGLNREADRLVSLLELRPGMTVAEIGAGSGRLAVRVAARLGPSGRLYATEIDPSRLEAIRRAAAAHNLSNIIVIRGVEDAANLPEGCCDAIYMRRVYHELAQPAPVMKGIRGALRDGGRLAVIDFLTPWWFRPRHGIAAPELDAQIASAGFTPAGRIEDWSLLDYLAMFRKPR